MRAHVLHQLPPSCKRLRARSTRVRLHPSVHAHVQPQPLLNRKSLLAVIANVHLAVGQRRRVQRGDVVLQGAGLPEGLVALRTRVRPLPRMDARVLAQVVLAEEKFLARFAFEVPRFLFGVCHLVKVSVW